MTEMTPEMRAFAADRMFGPDPSPRPRHQPAATVAEPPVTEPAPVNPDVGHDETGRPADPNTGARRIALWLAGAAVVAVVAIVVVLTGASGSGPTRSAAGVRPVPAPVASVAAASSTVAPNQDQDRAVPFTASADCPAGSTSARSLSDPAGDSAWTCVRGQQGARVDGQVLHVDFDGSYVLSAVSVTPGWVPTTPGGRDHWLQHRVVSRLQYVFDDADRTIFTQDTGNAHGPVTAALPHRVLASAVTVIVLQTARPPASPAPSQDPTTPARPGFGDSLLGPLGAPLPPDGDLTTDPTLAPDGGEDAVDATFAISGLTFLGHPPT